MDHADEDALHLNAWSQAGVRRSGRLYVGDVVT